MDINTILAQAGIRARYEPETLPPSVDPVLAAVEAAERELGIEPPPPEVLPPAEVKSTVKVFGSVAGEDLIVTGEPKGGAS